MSVELWHATLNPRGPHYSEWVDIFGVMRVPLKSPNPVLAGLGPEKNVEVYLLDIPALTIDQRARLLFSIAKRFNAPIYEVEAEVARSGFLIRAADVIVSYDMRAFV